MKIFLNKLMKLNYTLLGILLVMFCGCKKDKIETQEGIMAVTEYYPNSGKAGTLVTIKGSGFDTRLQNNTVDFGGVKGDVLSAEASKLVVRAPEGGKSGTLRIGSGSNNLDVGTYTYQTLSVKRVDPANGPAGSHIRIYGEGFSSRANPAVVTINGKVALVGSASDTLLVAEVPVAAGSGPIEVQVDGMKARGQDFTFQSIVSVKPVSGGKGTKVRIIGQGFEVLVAGNLVDFNGKSAKILESSKEGLVVEAPDGVETGPLAVTINGQRSTGPVFTVVPFPGIAEVSPLSGPAGVQMTIKGTYFSKEIDENKVLINGVEIKVSAASEKELTLTLPGGTGSGKVTVVVNDQKTDGPQFKDQQLSILDITPDNGLAGTSVTITGSGFNTSMAGNVVTFNGIQAQVTAATANKLTVQAPAQVTTGVIKVKAEGQEAQAPREFRRSGIQTVATGLNIRSLTVDEQGNIFAIDQSRHQVLKINTDGQRSLIAGDAGGQSGNQNGHGTNARFNFGVTSSIVIDKQQNLYVSEANNRAIRKISPSGDVTTIVANAGPVGKMVMRPDNSIIAAIGSGSLFRVTAAGKTESISPVTGLYIEMTDVQFAVDAAGGIYYVTNMEYPSISYNPITSPEDYNKGYGDGEYGAYRDGVGRNAQFSGSIKALVGDGKGAVLVADDYYIRSINVSTRMVSTFLKLGMGDQDGTLRDASLNSIIDLAIGSDGTIYLAQQNGSIRKIFFK